MPDAITPSPIDSEIEKLRSDISNKEAESASLSQRTEKLKSNLSELERLSGELTQAVGAYQSGLAASKIRFDELKSFFESSSKMIDKVLDEKQKADAKSKIEKVKGALKQKIEETQSKTAEFNKAAQARDTAKNANESCVANFRDLQKHLTDVNALLDNGANLKQQIEGEKSNPKKYFLSNWLKEELLDKVKILSPEDYATQLQKAWLAVKSAKEDLLTTEEKVNKFDKEKRELESAVRASIESLQADILRELEQPVTRNEKA
jgi:chromosome segregation ATPase